MKLALFDLDYTLIATNSNMAWQRFESSLNFGDTEWRHKQYQKYVEHYRSGCLDIFEYNSFCAQLAVQQTPAQFAQLSKRFVKEFVAPYVPQATRDLLAKHRRLGDEIVIITATNEIISRPIAEFLGVSHLIAVEMQIDEQTGWYNGRVKGVPSFRDGKVIRVTQWLASQALQWSDVASSTFYSDSISDLPLLERVDIPVATNPDAELLAEARKRNWQVLNLFAKE